MIDSDVHGGIDSFFAKLIRGECTECPFSHTHLEIVRAAMREVAAAHPVVPPADEEVQAQPVDVLLLGGVMKALGDPDADIMGTYAVGVPLGLNHDMPRTPEVFPPKNHWSLKEQMVWGGKNDRADDFKGTTKDNYPSARQFATEVESVLEDQASRDYPQVLALTEVEARARYGDQLTIAALAAIEKGVNSAGEVEVRVLHDGTNGIDLNRFIKVRDGGMFPVACDLKAVLRKQAASGIPHFGGSVDVKEAHRVVRIRRCDWPCIACQVHPGGKVYVNMVGTYGVASAAYWWGRLAAALQRVNLLVLGQEWPLWALLFADDWNLIAMGKSFMHSILAYVLLLCAFGVPISWKKSKGGFTYTWVGYELCLRSWALGISESRAAWLIGWYRDTLSAGAVCTRELREALGRMVFVYGALTWDRPFLGPLFAFMKVHAVGAYVQLPLYVRIVLKWLMDRLTTRRRHPLMVRKKLQKDVLRVDAKAEGLVVAVGGWAPKHRDDDTVDTWNSHGFRSVWTKYPPLGLMQRACLPTPFRLWSYWPAPWG